MKRILLSVLFASVFVSVHAATDARAIIAAATSNIVSRLSALSTKTNHLSKLATPENYALLKSSKLVDKVRRLALQAQIVEAVLADADNDEKQRFKWHGTYASQSVDFANETATFVHKDGYSVTVKFKTPNINEQVKAYNARLPKPPMTNGVPARLAAARLRRYDEKQNPVTTVSIDVNANTVERPSL